MDNVTFAITMVVVGMGGTLLTLGLIAAVISGVERLFPAEPETPSAPGSQPPTEL